MAFQLIDHQKLNQDYRGHAEKCTYRFTVWLPDQFGAAWTARKMLDGHVSELQSQGSRLLEFKLWEDKLSGTFTTEYKVEITASASPLWWNVIIIGVLAILSILFVSWIIDDVADIAEYAPGAVTAGAWALAALAVLGIAVVLKRRSG